MYLFDFYFNLNHFKLNIFMKIMARIIAFIVILSFLITGIIAFVD